jgi:hypothetical protein
MQAGQRGDGVARRARGRGGDTARPMRAMAAETTDGELTVRRFGLDGVTSCAWHLLGRARMGLMAANAGLVSDRRAGRFLLMTALARRRDGAAVWLMTADAVLVASVCVSMCIGMAARAGHVTGAGIVRQPAVAAFASGMPRPRGDQRELSLVTALTRRVLRERDLEVVRRVTALARCPIVKSVIGRGLLMATAAGPRDRRHGRRSRVRVVTAQAAPETGAFRVIRMDVPVAALTRRRGALFDVVRRVTARAERVRRHFGLREDDHVRVA